MDSKYSFVIAANFHEEFEKMAEIPVKISFFSNHYHVSGDNFSATVEGKELNQLCPNKRIVGKVVSTTGQPPIFVGENVQMIFLEKGKSKVKILLDSMSPEVLVRRFLREGELNEAERILRKKDFLLKFGVISGVILVAISAFLGGFYDTWNPIFIFLSFVLVWFGIDGIYTKQLKQVLD